MGLFDFLKRGGKEQPQKLLRLPKRRINFSGAVNSVRSFLAGDNDDLFINFKGTNLTADGEIFTSLSRMRGRSRKLCNDSDYARKYLELCKSNIVGHAGVKLTPKARRTPNDTELDREDNRVIAEAWKRWGKKENCSASQTLSWLDIQNLFVETVARDGECIVRLIKNYDNEFGFALQVYEGDILDVNLNQENLKNGNYISLGIEKDSWGKPVAYYFKTKSRTGHSSYEFATGLYERVPAEEIIHGFRAFRPNQTRGIPWLNTSIRSLKMLDGWLEAELTGARIAASKMGFYVEGEGADAYVGDDMDDDGTLVTEVTAGTFEKLPAGIDVKTFDAQYPKTDATDFVKVVLRSAAAGLGVSYNSLANDLESTSYSSMRSGALEERASWRLLQSWFIDTLCERVYLTWLSEALLRDAFVRPLPASKYNKFAEVEWTPRGWSWVDPLKDQQAAKIGIEMGLTSREEIASSQGKNYEDIFNQLAEENLLASNLGVSVEDVEQSPDENSGAEE
ncbi:MAG: putative portal protein [Prokaryotic dsDNA virus sp.]|nr:MAG: putative portal protein [Prokaryotic dsDNA virus sp.]|tara:strand:- start:2003 stop:3526 length:1524 start_codon:yes stop_codon:yes gene_type:complete